jgi:hypothetical protein
MAFNVSKSEFFAKSYIGSDSDVDESSSWFFTYLWKASNTLAKIQLEPSSRSFPIFTF